MTSARNKSLIAERIRSEAQAPFKLEPGELLRLRIFLDKSMLEIYANRRQRVTQHIYPARPDSLGVAIFSRRGTTTVLAADAWDMAATNAPISAE